MSENSLLRHMLFRAHVCLHRSVTRRAFNDDPTLDISNLQDEPEITLLTDILTFYQSYRQLEMRMARLYPSVPVARVTRTELDGSVRKMSVDLESELWNPNYPTE